MFGDNKNDWDLLPGTLDDEADLIPLLSTEDEEILNSMKIPDTLPILPLRNTVLFPGVVIPITVGRDKSIKLIKESYRGDKVIGVVSQKDVNVEDPEFNDLNKVGTAAQILKMLRMPDGNTTVIIQGKRRIKLESAVKEDPYIVANVTASGDAMAPEDDKEFAALIDSLKDLSLQIIKQSPQIPSEAAFAIKNIESAAFLTNFISSNMSAEVEQKQELLEMNDVNERAEKVLSMLTKELQMLELKNQIQSKVKGDLDKQQREYFLNQQLKTIQEELGGSSQDQEINELREKGRAMKWPEEAKDVFESELTRLQRMNPAAAEYSVTLSYVELLLELPWNKFTEDKFDLEKAQMILDRDHHGLDKVKDRIMEYLAVLKLKKDMKSPIMCLYGPPGVGKTSLGKSVAEALGREYVRMSLGGLRDEAEIRGHRKTYIGAMPGRIIQNLRKAKSANPVFVLDEIDKLARDAHGDPSSALLEVLDPEQNSKFYDNYLELGFDLSNVLFIATANNLGSIQAPLRDRMEIIEINGYTVEEKVQIAVKHLMPKQLAAHGLLKKHCSINNKILEKIVEDYTSESGVRNLEKKIASVIRSTAKSVATGKKYNPKISAEKLREILGAPIYLKDRYHSNGIAGVVTGLAWTPVGGDIIFIETSLNKGKGKLTLTGNLGNVMKESAVIALAYLKAHADELNIDNRVFDNYDIFIHVPEGATPKDGPSAGITMLTALASAFTQRKVKSKLAMTGEITLRGKVLPVGGIKEKILAARRAGIKDIILSESNRKDIEEIEEKYSKDLNFIYVEKMIEVMTHSLLDKRVANPMKFDFPEVAG